MSIKQHVLFCQWLTAHIVPVPSATGRPATSYIGQPPGNSSSSLTTGVVDAAKLSGYKHRRTAHSSHEFELKKN
jgi:hypothetical protein